MKFKTTLCLVATAALLPLAVQAQNIAIVNGKAVPKARLTALLAQMNKSGRPVPPEMQARAKDDVVMREILAQEAERRGIAATPEFKNQMELVRQGVLIRTMFDDFKAKNPASEAEAKADYDRIKAQAAGTEYRARHILVDSEDTAKKLIADIKAGASFEDLAKKNSKDPGSAAKGGDLDFAKADSYVPEFSQALEKLKKGEMTETPVKSAFGYHVIKLEDTREAPFPEFEAIKGQLMQRAEQIKLQEFQEQLRKAARTDYQFQE